jgi:general secretion pathway protein G
MKKTAKGFTLIEIIIVTTILALLAVLVIMNLKGQLFKGRDARRKADLHLIQEAVEEYEKDHDCYPPVELVDCSPGDGLKPYLPKIPCDPITKESYYYEPAEGICSKWYRIYAKLDNLKDSSLLAGIGLNGIDNFYLSSPNAPLPVSSTPPPSTSGPTLPPAPTPTLGPPSGYYGCFNGECDPISWDPDRPPDGNPECDPHYQSGNCLKQCIDKDGEPINECIPWK